MWSTVELREIRVFLTLAEELHFGRTADRLGLTPSRISQTIRMFETRVGGRLFTRSSRRVCITPLGERLQRRMRPAYTGMERAFVETREEATGLSGPVRIGTYSPINFGPRFLEIVRSFVASHPRCHVVTTDTGFARDQFDWLRRDELDVLAMRLPLSRPELTIGPILSRERRMLALASDHPLAARDSVCVDDLAGYTLSEVPTLPRELVDAFSPPITPSGHRLQRAAIHSVSEAMVRVATGEIIHPTVHSFLAYYQSSGVVGVPIRDLPPSETAFVWLTARENAKIRALAGVAADVMARHPLAKRPS
jgi:DNA-binding transcriptional LysR family regulator